MKCETQILPGIKAIGWLDCRHLPRRVDLLGICVMPLPILTDIHPIAFFGEPDCRCQRKKSTAGYEDNATLKFLSTDDLPHDIPLGFVVTDVNEQTFLIGSREAPLPIVEREQRMGAPSTDAAGIQYEVKHVALRTLIPCDI